MGEPTTAKNGEPMTDSPNVIVIDGRHADVAVTDHGERP
jgi:hypothetical protein